MGDAFVPSALMKHPLRPFPGQMLFCPGGHRGGSSFVTGLHPANTLQSEVGAGLPAPQRDPRERRSGSTPAILGGFLLPSCRALCSGSLHPSPSCRPQRPTHLASLSSSTLPPPFSPEVLEDTVVFPAYLFRMTPEPVTQTLYYVGFSLLLWLLIIHGNKQRKIQWAQMGRDYPSRSELASMVPLATRGYGAFETWPVSNGMCWKCEMHTRF